MFSGHSRSIVFVVVYSSTFFFLCTLLFPDTMQEYKGYSDYFMSRRGWFFGILIGAFVLDVFDVYIKSPAYFQSFGFAYWLRFAFYVAGSIAAIAISNVRFQVGFALAAFLYECAWAVTFYETLT